MSRGRLDCGDKYTDFVKCVVEIIQDQSKAFKATPFGGRLWGTYVTVNETRDLFQ